MQNKAPNEMKALNQVLVKGEASQGKSVFEMKKDVNGRTTRTSDNVCYDVWTEYPGKFDDVVPMTSPSSYLRLPEFILHVE